MRALAACAAVVFAAASPPPLLPVLARIQRSDWANVYDLGAVGNGVADDTAALQAGLDAISAKGARNLTLFFPAGTFLVTRTLRMNLTYGAALLGVGRGSVLLWGGDADASMLWSSGCSRSIVEGLVFDGAGRAGVGYDHDTVSAYYETREVHRHLAFLNFRTAGVRVGAANSNVPSAEMTFTNCVFGNSTAGLALLQFNDYDNYLTGCLFTDCGTGILNEHGMAYVTNTRFERSTVADATVSGQPNSFRRVVSVGSRQFLAPGQPGAGSPTKVHASYVSGWGVPGAALDAMALADRGPFQLVDSVFVDPVDPASCAFGVVGGDGAMDALILSNVTAACVLNAKTASLARVYTVPPGAAAASLPALGPGTTFFRSVWPWPQPPRVIDVVRDHGADPTGRINAAPALQACVDAAAGAGGGAECYVPAGAFALNATVYLCGADFALGGSGYASQLQAARGFAAPLLAAGPGAGCNASRFTVRSLKVLSPGDAGVPPDFVLSRAAAVPASRTGKYGAFRLRGGGDPAAPVAVTLDSASFMSSSGYILNGLTAGDVVSGSLWDGNPTVVDSGDSLLFAGFLALGYGASEIARPTTRGVPAAGFFGAAMMASSSKTPFDWNVFDSGSLVAQDYYSETPHGIMHLAGAPGDAPGRVVVSAAKANTQAGYSMLAVDGYAGDVLQTGANIHFGQANLSIAGSSPVRVALVGSASWTPGLLITNSNPNAEVSVLGCIVANNSYNGWLEDELHADTLAVIARGFDALRELGAVDLHLNFPGGI